MNETGKMEMNHNLVQTLESVITPVNYSLGSDDDDDDNTTPAASVSVSVSRYIFILEARGGTDKDPNTGHRRDSLPIAHAIAKHDDKCRVAILSYSEEEVEDDEKEEEVEVEDDIDVKDKYNHKHQLMNQAVESYILQNATGILVRVNPGTLSAYTQTKLDLFLSKCTDAAASSPSSSSSSSSSKIFVFSPPELTRRMGAKDTLYHIRHLSMGMSDTAVYYNAEEFTKGFLMRLAKGPRVIKQNRGSQGEGIWICRLKEGKYSSRVDGEEEEEEELGDDYHLVGLDEELVLMEANDNHVENHTVGEFIEFCINGRTETSGTWESTGKGQYLEGGIDSGAMIVDQRFLPRVVEGEIRCNMMGSKLLSIIHKKPRPGGFSATLQSGAIYTMYEPDEPLFQDLVTKFRMDLPRFMQVFDIQDEKDLPILWTVDFMFGDKDEFGKDTFYVGEVNCSCVGITQQLHLAENVGKMVVDLCFPTSQDDHDNNDNDDDHIKINTIAKDGPKWFETLFKSHAQVLIVTTSLLCLAQMYMSSGRNASMNRKIS